MGNKQRGCFSFLSSPSTHNPSTLALALLGPLILGTLFTPSDSFLRVATKEAGVGRKAAASRRNEVGEKDVIVQAFQMNWRSVGRECEDWLGPAGVGYVQVSPPTEHVEGLEWWTDYQTVSYRIRSKRGTRDEFAHMVKRCHQAGVRVLVDAVVNLAGPRTGESGVDGSRFEHYEYPGIYRPTDFHKCRPNGDNMIKTYQSRFEVQNCELVGLADLATESPYVVARLGAYLNDLVSLGVDGFRVDSAKHIASDHISIILQEVKGEPFVVQEVPFGMDEPIHPVEYVQNGHVHEFRSAFDLKDAFLASGVARLVNNWGATWVPSDRAAGFVVNHDTERQGTTLNFRSPANAHLLATVFLLSQPYGAPTILSSYAYDDDNTGPPQFSSGFTRDLECDVGTWRCEHRAPAIMNMIAFHNAVRGQPSSAVTDGRNRLAMSRGDVGHVAINNDDEAWIVSLHTRLPDGQYCDLIHDTSASPLTCDSYTVTVGGGVMAIVVPPRDAVAVFAGRTPGNGIDISHIPRTRARSSVEVVILAPTEPGQIMMMVGENTAMGSWDPSRGLRMSQDSSGSRWGTRLELFAGDSVEFKFVKLDASGEAVWESGANRQLQLPTAGTVRREFGWPTDFS